MCHFEYFRGILVIRVLVFYIGVLKNKKKKQKNKTKQKKGLNFVVLYLENTCRSTKNKVYCSSWETAKKKKKKKYLENNYRSTKKKKREYIVVAGKPQPKKKKKKEYIVAVTKKPLLKRDL